VVGPFAEMMVIGFEIVSVVKLFLALAINEFD
jgi:hypothetical protein